MKIPHDHKWDSVYITKPVDGQVCASKISGEEDYVSSCIYKNGYFETYENKRNRVIITRWKHDLWLPVQTFEELLCQQ